VSRVYGIENTVPMTPYLRHVYDTQLNEGEALLDFARCTRGYAEGCSDRVIHELYEYRRMQSKTLTIYGCTIRMTWEMLDSKSTVSGEVCKTTKTCIPSDRK
jgi:hypothetical protein